MRNILVIIKKQLKDTFKNKTILIQFVMFPMLTILMENAVNIEGMEPLFFTKLFSTMFMGMAPLTATAGIISEEKEKDTLRVLMMANVKPWQYLIGIATYVWTICMIGAGVMSTTIPSSLVKTSSAQISESAVASYLSIMAIGFVISTLAGAAIGVFAKNQMTATSLTVPVMLILSFAPMLSMFNDKIEKVARAFFTQQLKITLDKMAFSSLSSTGVIIIIANAAVFTALFVFAYQRKGLE